MNEPDIDQGSKSRMLARVLTFYLLVAVWVVVLLGRLLYLQGVQGPEYRLLAESQQQGFLEISARRGDILDRNLEELATSVPAESVFAHPAQVDNPFEAARQLSKLLDLSMEEAFQRLSSDRSFVYLQRKVSPQQGALVRGLGLPGIYTQKESRRVYPNRELAGQVLGFVGMDNDGLGGLEYRFNEQVKGATTRVHLRLDARRNAIDRTPVGKEVEGNILVLTLDRTIQHIAEQVLRDTIVSSGAKSGSVVVMDPSDGQVLAMASYPFFNPNNYREFSPDAQRNRPILENYEPGSTFKVVTLSGVLSEDLATLDEVIDCRVGTVRLAGKVYKEAKRSFEDLTVQEVIAKSSNVGAVKLGIRLGEQRLYEYIRRFGFGERTGIELPGEEAGLLRPPPQWSRISIGALSIGQELAVTPLQMARAASVFASGGYLVDPHIVRQILSPAGDLVRQTTPERRRMLDEGIAGMMTRAMAYTILEGTGRSAQLNGYSAAGKTGTAQKIVDGRYSTSRYVASFVGFAPVHDPDLVAVVVIDEPKGVYFGGHVAGPAFREIMERSLIHLKVPQDRPFRLDPPPLELAGGLSGRSRERTLESLPVEESLAAEDLARTVLALRAGSESDAAAGGPVTVDLDSRMLPDFTGMSLREVAELCARLGIQLKISGSGSAVSQRPDPGRKVYPGAVCEVFFSQTAPPRSASRQDAAVRQ
ncbi:MAG TPA: penicillin-binding protein [Acidobacteriota bacterium]|nr:penicillin-binding protein [Acidobacteriota bacterium]